MGSLRNGRRQDRDLELDRLRGTFVRGAAGNAAVRKSRVPHRDQTFAKRRRLLDRRLEGAASCGNSIMSANPSITIDAARRHAAVEKRSVERAGRSDLGSFFVAALFAAVVVPAMTGWLYLLAITFWKIVNWMIA